MELLLRGAYLEIFPDLRAAVERGLDQALSRGHFTARRAIVSLRQVGGSRWHCVMGVRIPGQGKITAQATSPLPSTAVDEATRKLARVVMRAASLKSRSSRRSRRSAEAVPQWGGRRLSLS